MDTNNVVFSEHYIAKDIVVRPLLQQVLQVQMYSREKLNVP